MGIVFVLVPLSIFLGVVFVVAYGWSVHSDQYEDLETPPLRILSDDE
jgi:cbb3-type cytochrome oxidase maturation protein